MGGEHRGARVVWEGFLEGVVSKNPQRNDRAYRQGSTGNVTWAEARGKGRTVDRH